ncbi:MAG: DUF4382 domain-containing protein [Vulcanimicrobiaceae bacterium]|jgi:hypothetical protein
MNRVLSAVALAALIGGSACSAPSGTSGVSPTLAQSQSTTRHTEEVVGNGPPGIVVVDLYDAPMALGPNAQVNVAIDGVNVVTGETAYPLVSYASAQIVNLLQLQQVADAIQGQLPPGSYSSLELLVDPSQSNVVDSQGNSYPIVFRTGKGRWGWSSSRRSARGGSSSSRSTEEVVGNGPPSLYALTASVSINATSGGTTDVAVDFNVLESVSIKNGVAYVTANLAAATQPSSVGGVVANQAGGPVVGATVLATDASGNVDNTTVTASDGSFTLHALAGGAYTISVLNSYTSDSGNTITATGNDPGAAPSVPIDLAPSDQLNIGTLID